MFFKEEIHFSQTPYADRDIKARLSKELFIFLLLIPANVEQQEQDVYVEMSSNT
jgi:hypothetical protein